MSTGSIAGAGQPEYYLRQPATINGDPIDSLTSASSTTPKAINVSSGNPKIQETRAVMHLFPNDASSTLPVGRKPTVSVLRVPNYMTYADFGKFFGSFIEHILEMRVFRIDGVEARYSVWARFDNQDSADKFHKHFDEKRFNSFEEELCRVRFTVDVQFTGYSGSLELARPSTSSIAEQPSCPVCLERFDQEMGGILTTICNHSFHCSCISKWSDSSCPVCRYCQEQSEKSICFVCQISENLWICIICGFVGCGRCKGGHSIKHWEETQHCYSLELETHRVWDHAGDNYVHRLIQTNTDGKLAEWNDKDGRGGCDCAYSGFGEALLNSKVDVIENEYNELLATQHENQKLYFEALLWDIEVEENVMEASTAAALGELLVSPEVREWCTKVIRYKKEEEGLLKLHEDFLKRRATWETKIRKIKNREKEDLKAKDDRIKELRDQLRDLGVHPKAGMSAGQQSVSDEPSPKNHAKQGRKANNEEKLKLLMELGLSESYRKQTRKG